MRKNNIDDYNTRVELLRDKEFKHASSIIHLDHAASTLYPQSLITHCAQDLLHNMYSNPRTYIYIDNTLNNDTHTE
jgi:selenocysteine lyase/cysteine desulfurase